ncbi:MAG: hypothetical protein M3Q69_01000 [Acidobacteriota bacterium]|nr:hypothetical protein [Acidobacteriota bacterium]
MKHALLAFTLLTAPIAHAKDVSIGVTTDKERVVAHERITLRLEVSNLSSGPLHNVRTFAGFEYDWTGLTVTAPAGWTCTNRESVVCSKSSMAPGETAVIVASGLAPDPDPRLIPHGSAAVIALNAQNQDVRDHEDIRLTIERARFTSQLVMDIDGPDVILPGRNGSYTTTVTNRGPDPTDAVWTTVYYFDFPTQTSTPVAVSGEGWQCTPNAYLTLCRHGAMAPGETASLTVHVTAPMQPGSKELSARSVAEERAKSVAGASKQLSFGDASQYERILVPLAYPFLGLPGGSNYPWFTTVQVYLDGNTPIETFPECLDVKCPAEAFDPGRPLGFGPFVQRSTYGRFLAFHRGDADKVHINIRVMHRSRAADTWGAEVPIVREKDLKTGKIVLLSLPTSRAFRRTLRIYDDGLTPDPRVLVVVHPFDETTTIASFIRPLAPQSGGVTPALLPRFPSYAEFDPVLDGAIDSTRTPIVWLEIIPLTPGMRFWAMASVTHSETNNVTIITPQ